MVRPFALSVLFLTACSTVRHPTVQVSGVSAGERTDEAVRLDFAVDVTNPNDLPLELLSFDYELAVDGRHVYRGRRSAEASLDRKGTRRISLPAVVRLEDGRLPGEIECRLRGSLLYLAPGELAEILLDTGLRRPRARFSDSRRAVLAGPGGS